MHKDWIKIFEKYSFLDKVERKGLYCVFYYTENGVNQYKKIPMRSSPKTFRDVINKIRLKVGVNKYGKPKTRIYTF